MFEFETHHKRLVELRHHLLAKALEIQRRVSEQGRTKDASERAQYREFVEEIGHIDDELADLVSLRTVSEREVA